MAPVKADLGVQRSMWVLRYRGPGRMVPAREPLAPPATVARRHGTAHYCHRSSLLGTRPHTQNSKSSSGKKLNHQWWEAGFPAAVAATELTVLSEGKEVTQPS